MKTLTLLLTIIALHSCYKSDINLLYESYIEYQGQEIELTEAYLTESGLLFKNDSIQIEVYSDLPKEITEITGKLIIHQDTINYSGWLNIDYLDKIEDEYYLMCVVNGKYESKIFKLIHKDNLQIVRIIKLKILQNEYRN